MLSAWLLREEAGPAGTAKWFCQAGPVPCRVLTRAHWGRREGPMPDAQADLALSGLAPSSCRLCFAPQAADCLSGSWRCGWGARINVFWRWLCLAASGSLLLSHFIVDGEVGAWSVLRLQVQRQAGAMPGAAHNPALRRLISRFSAAVGRKGPLALSGSGCRGLSTCAGLCPGPVGDLAGSVWETTIPAAISSSPRARARRPRRCFWLLLPDAELMRHGDACPWLAGIGTPVAGRSQAQSPGLCPSRARLPVHLPVALERAGLAHLQI